MLYSLNSLREEVELNNSLRRTTTAQIIYPFIYFLVYQLGTGGFAQKAAYQNLCKIFRISEWVTPVPYKITPSSKQGAITSAYFG